MYTIKDVIESGLEEDVCNTGMDLIPSLNHSIDITSKEPNTLNLDLYEVPINLSNPLDGTDYFDFSTFNSDELLVVSDINTKQIWVLDKSDFSSLFVYIKDLNVKCVTTGEEYDNAIRELLSNYPKGKILSKCCYILDNPVLEKYLVYYNPKDVIKEYGKPTPTGCNIIKYEDRFSRDLGILELERKYSTSTSKRIREGLTEKINENQAVIISDGSYRKGLCSNAFVYMDSESMVTMSECIKSNNYNKGAIVAEIKGAINALRMCMLNGKKEIFYFYDNLGVIYSISNLKYKKVTEVSLFKDLLVKLDKEGYSVSFIDIHPKKIQKDEKEDNDLLNRRKQVKFLHNICDEMCTNINDLYNGEYKDKVFIDRDNKVTLEYVLNKGKKKSQ